MRRAFLFVRSGERPFPASLLPGWDVFEGVSHSIETVDPPPASGTFDLVIVTSRAGADRFVTRPERTSAGSARVIAVGPATAAGLRAKIDRDVEDGGGSARRVLDRLPADLGGRRVLLPRGSDASDELPRALSARGADVVPLVVYRKRIRPYDGTLDTVVESGRVHVFCATSPSAARWLLDGASPEARKRLLSTTAIALGESTSRTLSAFGVARVEIAELPTLETVAAELRGLEGRVPRA